ncbi:hypothetical protein MMC34_005839 [Xylographa carneopallida]|nr:hypothetical protein [Xylographa carneopallida]
MFHLFQRYAGPSPGELQDRAERQWRADLLRFYKAVVEKRRMHGFQDRVQTPDADGVQEQALPVEKENVPKMRPDPERVQELREMRSWRPVAAVVQPVLSQSIEAVEKDIKSLTIAQLKPFLRAEGLAVSGTKAQMQERFMELINTRVQEGTVSEFNRLAFLVAHVKFRLNRIAGVTSDPPTRQDQHGPIAARLLQRHRQSLGNVTVLQ